MNDNKQRGTGRTTRQIQTAPRDAYFVVHNQQMVRYAQDIADRLGREDLLIIALTTVRPERFRGISCSIVLDHYIVENGLGNIDLDNVELLR